MSISDLIGKTCGCIVGAGSALLGLLFSPSFAILSPIILLHLFLNWYTTKVKTNFIKKTMVAMEVILSISAIFGYFIVCNVVFLLIPGSRLFKDVSRNMIILLYTYFVLYSFYTVYIILGYLNENVSEDDDSSDVIRCNQLKTLNREENGHVQL